MKRLTILAAGVCGGAIATIILAARVGITWLGLPMLIVASVAAVVFIAAVLESNDP